MDDLHAIVASLPQIDINLMALIGALWLWRIDRAVAILQVRVNELSNLIERLNP